MCTLAYAHRKSYYDWLKRRRQVIYGPPNFLVYTEILRIIWTQLLCLKHTSTIAGLPLNANLPYRPICFTQKLNNHTLYFIVHFHPYFCCLKCLLYAKNKFQKINVFCAVLLFFLHCYFIAERHKCCRRFYRIYQYFISATRINFCKNLLRLFKFKINN